MTRTNPRIAVLGAGAQGASIGADLLRAGLDVTYIEQWPAHVEAMRARGIEVRLPDETHVTPVHPLHLCEVATLREPFDIVFVVVKAYDTRWVSELIAPYVADDGLVVGLQNGMTQDAIAAAVGAHRTMGAVIEVASNMFEPGIGEPADARLGLVVRRRRVRRRGPWTRTGGAGGALAHRTCRRLPRYPLVQVDEARGQRR